MKISRENKGKRGAKCRKFLQKREGVKKNKKKLKKLKKIEKTRSKQLDLNFVS
jgi:hypothetical protein